VLPVVPIVNEILGDWCPRRPAEAIDGAEPRFIARHLRDGQPRRLWPYSLALWSIAGAGRGVSRILRIAMHELRRGFKFRRRMDVVAGYFALLVALVT